VIFSLREHAFFSPHFNLYQDRPFSPSLARGRIERKNRGAKGEEVVSMFVFPTEEEIKTIRKKIESGFDLEDWEVWVYREFM